MGPSGPAPRGPQPGLSPSGIITLLLVLHSSGFKYLRSFYHGFAEPLLRGSFPGLPCYEHFVALQKSVFVPLVFFLHSHLGTRTGLYYIDSTALPVCDNHRINRHKVFAGLAQRGKTSMGWLWCINGVEDRLRPLCRFSGDLAGMPRLVMRLITVQAMRASTFCADRVRARRLRPIKTLYL